MSPGLRCIARAAVPAAAVAGLLGAAAAGPSSAAVVGPPVPGGLYQGATGAGGAISLYVDDRARAIENGLSFSVLRARCRGGGEVTMYNVSIPDRSIRIRRGRFSASAGGARVQGRFLRGGRVTGTVWIVLDGGRCSSGPVRFSAHV